MQTISNYPVPEEPNTGPRRLFTMGLAAVMIFAVGVGVGSSQRISLGSDKVFRQSTQKNAPENLDYRSVEQLYDILRQDFDGQLDAGKLLDGLKQGLASASGDDYTEYLNAEAAREFDDELNGTFSGIGAELSKDKSVIVIVSPIAGFPAEKAGLKPKDVIAEIDGKSAVDISVSEAVNKIRGPENTSVKLKIIRGGTQELDFDIQRRQITIPSVESEILEGDIGYLKITRFSEDTDALAEQAASKFKTAAVKGVILDMRNDPGGLLNAAVDVSGIWLPEGKTILQERRNDVTIKTFSSRGPAILNGIKTVVLINEGSASASEIVAGALKDNGVATLIGVKSFGKGSVQQLERLPDGGVLKVTIARWFTPGGKNIDKEGITPDQEVKRSDEDFKNNKDPQKDAAIEFLNK